MTIPRTTDVRELLEALASSGGPRVDAGTEGDRAVELAADCEVQPGHGTRVVETILATLGCAIYETNGASRVIALDEGVLGALSSKPLLQPDLAYPARLSRVSVLARELDASAIQRSLGIRGRDRVRVALAPAGTFIDIVGTARPVLSVALTLGFDGVDRSALEAKGLIPTARVDAPSVDFEGQPLRYGEIFRRVGSVVGAQFLFVNPVRRRRATQELPRTVDSEDAFQWLSDWMEVNDLMVTAIASDPPLFAVASPRSGRFWQWHSLATPASKIDELVTFGALNVETVASVESAPDIFLFGTILNINREAVWTLRPRAYAQALQVGHRLGALDGSRDAAQVPRLRAELDALEQRKQELAVTDLHLMGQPRLLQNWIRVTGRASDPVEAMIPETTADLRLSDCTMGELARAWAAVGGPEPAFFREERGDAVRVGLSSDVVIPAGRGSAFVHAVIAARGCALIPRGKAYYVANLTFGRVAPQGLPWRSSYFGDPTDGQDAVFRCTPIPGLSAPRPLISALMRPRPYDIQIGSCLASPGLDAVVASTAHAVRELGWLLRQADASTLEHRPPTLPRGKTELVFEAGVTPAEALRRAGLALGCVLVGPDPDQFLASPEPERVAAADVFRWLNSWLARHDVVLGTLPADPPLFVWQPVSTLSHGDAIGWTSIDSASTGECGELDALLVQTVVNCSGADASDLVEQIWSEPRRKIERCFALTPKRLVLRATAARVHELREAAEARMVEARSD